MTMRKHTAALALTGAIALASGAYALGSQTDGSAVAAGDNARDPAPAHFAGGPGRPHGPFGLDRLADRLGVDVDKLEDALEDLKPERPRLDEVKDDFASELADELGTTEAKVEAALERIRERHMREHEQRFDELAERLADRLNLDAAKVKEALEAPRLFRFRPGP